MDGDSLPDWLLQCGGKEEPNTIIMCDECDDGYHLKFVYLFYLISALWNRNCFLRFRFRVRFRLLKVMVPVPTFEKLWFRFLLLKSSGAGSGSGSSSKSRP
jgi:hypothetical protein